MTIQRQQQRPPRHLLPRSPPALAPAPPCALSSRRGAAPQSQALLSGRGHASPSWRLVPTKGSCVSSAVMCVSCPQSAPGPDEARSPQTHVQSPHNQGQTCVRNLAVPPPPPLWSTQLFVGAAEHAAPQHALHPHPGLRLPRHTVQPLASRSVPLTAATCLQTLRYPPVQPEPDTHSSDPTLRPDHVAGGSLLLSLQEPPQLPLQGPGSGEGQPGPWNPLP